MNFFEFPELITVQVALIVASVFWYFRRVDEVPILISLLIFYVSSFRYLVVQFGINEWIPASEVFGLPDITNAAALHALETIVAGQISLLAGYMFLHRHVYVNENGLENYFCRRSFPRPRFVEQGGHFLSSRFGCIIGI